jgi:integrase
MRETLIGALIFLPDARAMVEAVDAAGKMRRVTQQAIDDAAVKLYPVSTSPTRNRQCHTVVSAILKHAGEDFKIRRPKGWRGSKRVFWLWPEQAFRLFAAAEEVDAEFGLFLRFLFYTGMRLSEALLLKLDNVQLSEGYAYLPDSKNDEPRAIFLPPHLVAALANHPRGMSRRGTVFRFRKNGRLYALLSKAKMAAGAPPPSTRRGGEVMSDPVCVNAHDRCYEGGPCPLCEPAPSWQQKMKDTIATLTAERDEWRDEFDRVERELLTRVHGLEEALRGLVELKAMKGELLNLRSDPYYASQAAMLEVQYEQRKPLAWAKARTALAQETQG